MFGQNAKRLKFSIAFVIAEMLTAPAWAGPATNPIIKLDMTRVSNSKLMLGEPVILYYKITNPNEKPLSIYLGLDGGSGATRWLTRTLLDSQGKRVPELVDPTITLAGGFHMDDIQVSPKSFREGYIVASQWFRFPSTGNYRLSVHVHLPYAVDGEPNRTASGAALEQNFNFPLTVIPADSIQLRSIADEFRASAFTAQDRQAVLIKALFSMPESMAADSWQALASDPLLNATARTAIAAELTRVNSVKAADILADLIWNPAQSPDVMSPLPVSVLGQMYVQGDAILKKHIQHLYTLHGLKVPVSNVTLINGG